MFPDARPGGDSAAVSTELAGVAAAFRRFKLSEIAIGDRCREIKVEGELDLTVSDQLQDAIARCHGDQILISLEACQFIDSTGIAVIVRARRSEDSRVVVHGARGQVLRVLEATGLTADGPVFADREQALSALVRPVAS